LPLDFAAVDASLAIHREDALVRLPWLGATFRDPAAFWQALVADAASTSSIPPKSRPGERYDLYHDMVVRHLVKGRAALSWYDRRARKIQSLAYTDLHDESARMAGSWLAQKVEPGDVLAIVLPLGRAFLVAFCAALRLGLLPCFLPPRGDLYLADRLKKLAPDHVATDPLHLTLLDAKTQEIILGAAPAAPFERSFTYPTKKPCALVFSPLRAPLDTPLPLPSDTAYLGALRDARVALSLRPGDVVAAPAAHPTQHHPCLLVSTLLAGATFLHLTLEDLAQDPTLLTQQPLRALGIARALRETLSPANGPLTRVGLWFENPEEPSEPIERRALVEAIGLDKTPAAQLIFDAAAGGATHFSARRVALVGPKGLPCVSSSTSKLLPSAAVPWALFELDGSGREAAGRTGLFAVTPTKEPAEVGHVVVAQAAGDELVYGGAIGRRRDGRVYPEGEVIEAVSDLPFVTGAAVTMVSSGVGTGALFLLLLFTGAESPEVVAKEAASRTAAVAGTIRRRLGEDALPDDTLFFPLYARLDRKGNVDHAWCEAQLLRGSLTRKAGEASFQALTAVRKRFVKGVA
jgi:hypothetical protein